MIYIRKILSFLFLGLVFLALVECGRRGTPGGGPKDTSPPVVVRAEPPNLSTNFEGDEIRIYFDEYIQLEDVTNQLIISPPLIYPPEITPMGGASKYIRIIIKDTLRPNTTYTLNFGQSIVDNNERNPNSFLSYVFSTGDYIDSLSLSGVVKDAYNRITDEFISVMLYEIDSTYTDSTVYQKPPYYITNTLDSTTIFTLKNLKKGKYALFAIKDEDKNNFYNPLADKIGFLEDTISLPTDTVYLLSLFKQIPDYSTSVPTFAASNKIIFGFKGASPPKLELISEVPDSVAYRFEREPGKDSINFWFTPLEADSLNFTLSHPALDSIDSLTVKTMRLTRDSLVIRPSSSGSLNPDDSLFLNSSTPLAAIDTALFRLSDRDSVEIKPEIRLDTLDRRIFLGFTKDPEQQYALEIFPGAITDFFGETTDSLKYSFGTRNLEEYGNLELTLEGDIDYPIIAQMVDERGEVIKESYQKESGPVRFKYLMPGNYYIRVIIDENENGRWDTGNYLEKRQPERVIYHLPAIEMRANWDEIRTITIE